MRSARVSVVLVGTVHVTIGHLTARGRQQSAPGPSHAVAATSHKVLIVLRRRHQDVTPHEHAGLVASSMEFGGHQRNVRATARVQARGHSAGCTLLATVGRTARRAIVTGRVVARVGTGEQTSMSKQTQSVTSIDHTRVDRCSRRLAGVRGCRHGHCSASSCWVP